MSAQEAVTPRYSSDSSEPNCQKWPGKRCECAANCAVILLIVSSMVLLAAEADSSHDVPDDFVWANLVVSILFTLELIVRLVRPCCECRCPDMLWFMDLVVICTQGIDVLVTLRAREAKSENHATADLRRIAQNLRWCRIVRCLRVIPLFTTMKVQMDRFNGALWPLVFYLLVLVLSITTVATMTRAVVGEACSDVESCGEHFESIWESMYNVFMGTFGGLDFYDLVTPLWDVSGAACVILCLYMFLIYLVKTVLTAHLCQKFVETASADQVEERREQLWNKITGGSDSISLDLFKKALEDRRSCPSSLALRRRTSARELTIS
ncbi:unnamed protein product [Symbiodinium sp. CCMP2592]|nr:unnamed protein product [Symbiodinium sp. CCMP2592]